MLAVKKILENGLSLARNPRLKPVIITLADQAVYSGSSFATGVVVGRLLSIGDFGAFSLGLSLMIFSLILQDTLLATPYTYHFHKSDGRKQPALRAGAIVQSLLLSLVCLAGLLLAARLFHATPEQRALQPILQALGLSMPFLFLRECLRRQFFAEFRMMQALKLDSAVSALQFSLFGIAWLAGLLSPASVFFLMAIAAAAGAGTAGYMLRHEYDFRRMNVLADTRDNIHFGRWLLAGSVCHLGSLYAYPWLVYLLYGKAEAGAFAACYNLINLLNPLILGFNNYFRPKIIQTHLREGADAMDAMVRRSCLVFLPAGIFIVLFLVLFGGWLVRFVYGAEFSGLGPVIGLVSLSVLAIVVNAPLQLGTLALSRPQINPAFHGVALGVTVLFGVPLVMIFGKMGAAAGYTLASVAACAVLALMYRRAVEKEKAAPGA